MKKFVAYLVLIALLSVSLQPFTLSVSVAAANEDSTSYKKGLQEGRRAANEDMELLWASLDFAYGFLLGPVALAHSLIFDYLMSFQKLPDKRKDQIATKSKEYRKGYERGYKEIKSRNKLALRVTGWAGWIGTWFVLDQMRK